MKENGWIRDPSTGVLINVDNESRKEFINDKKREIEINNLKAQLDELKEMVKTIMEKM